MRPRLSTGSLPAPRPPERPAPRRRHSAVALIVEDNRSMRELLSHALKRIPGMRTVEACDGLDALNKIKDGAPDIIVTDINMPVMDGLTMLKRIRAEQALVSIPILVITTEQGAADRARAFALGATSFVTKPVRAPRVLEEVRSLLAM